MASFDPKAFLAKVSEGTAISECKKGQILFSQGEVGDAAFYIQKGKIKLSFSLQSGHASAIS